MRYMHWAPDVYYNAPISLVKRIIEVMVGEAKRTGKLK
jgi:hypothetical protein